MNANIDSRRLDVLSLCAGILILASAPAFAGASRVIELIEAAFLLTPDLERGEDLYRKHCRGCHGSRGFGNATKLVPSLAGQRQRYLVKQFADYMSRMGKDPAPTN